MRTLLACTLALLLSLTVSADDKQPAPIDVTLLVGKWEQKGKKAGTPARLTLLKDGRLTYTVKDADGGAKFVGTYHVAGAKLTMTMGSDDKEQKLQPSRVVTKLTDTELVTKDENGTEHTFARVK